ncbi:MAG: QueT transporter family protein [Massiliimalia sp.]|jgi:uncharacterized membrane protein
MKNNGKNTMQMAQIAMIAAIYATLTLVLAPISFSVVQFRISELLTVLPLFTPLAVPGLTLGCFLANLLGALLGMNPTGYLDSIVGTCATLLAALCTYWIGQKFSRPGVRFALAPLPPVIFNMIIVGVELTLLFNQGASFVPAFLANAISVAVGEAVVCYVLGVPFMMVLSKNQFYRKIFRCS